MKQEIPKLVLLTASDGIRHIAVRPDQVPSFVFHHHDAPLVFWNVAFDYEVVLKYLVDEAWVISKGLWRQALESGRIIDLMLLDFLVNLGSPDRGRPPQIRGLAAAAKDLLEGVVVVKDKEIREGFTPAFWDSPDPERLDYAVRDAVVTKALASVILERAHKLAGAPTNASEKWGLLTSGLQVRASVALGAIGRRGMALDGQAVSAARLRLRKEVYQYVKVIKKDYPGVLSYYKERKKKGRLKTNKNTKVPHLLAPGMRQYLAAAAEEVGLNPKDLPRTPKTGELAARIDFWRAACPDNRFVKTWTSMMDTAKLLQFVVQLGGKETVHPSYRPLVRTGRTSCVKPNIQNQPTEGWFRGLFVARPGHKFIIADYSAIELYSLAAVLLHLYGQSTLAEVLRDGRDPHAFTAAIVSGETYEAVKAGVQAEKDAARQAVCGAGGRGHFTRLRQSAKAINFGVPGGLGARRLVDYAKANYGVDMTLTQARSLRTKLITEVYPEFERYLESNDAEVIAGNLHCLPEQVREILALDGVSDFQRLGDFQRVMKGERRNRRSYIWDALLGLCRNPDLKDDLLCRRASQSLFRKLCCETVTTLTGRIRAGCDYGEARNTRFQGLAADGAKVALWEFHKRGFPIVAFVHDEIVAELPNDEQLLGNEEFMVGIMKDSMKSVLGPGSDLPIQVETTIADRWCK